ncbi:unnamed protein product, partial [Rotaria sp. Silwood2]
MTAKIQDWLITKSSPNKQAFSFENTFQMTKNENLLDAVKRRFEYFHLFIRSQTEQTIFNDLEHIMQYTINDIQIIRNPDKFSQRIGAYFYVYRRTAEYIWSRNDKSSLQGFQKILFNQLTEVFVETNGTEPNICITDKNILRYLNIWQHLSSITRITNKQELNTFLVLCKLSMQSSVITLDKSSTLKWINAVSQIIEIKIDLEFFIKQYLTYKDAFKDFPICINEYVYLINKMRPKKSKASLLNLFIELSQKLNFQDAVFLEHFKRTFDTDIKIFEHVCEAFVYKQTQDEYCLYQLTKHELKTLLNINLLSTSSIDIQKPFRLRIIQKLLFSTSPGKLHNMPEKIKSIFENLNDFDRNICDTFDPAVIIEDEWLKDFLINFPDIWSKFSCDIYRYMGDNHHNNRWTIHIWSRIIQLSLSKAPQDKANVILNNMTEWMSVVHHDIYNPNDILTIILVVKLFEIIIASHNKSIFSFPNIQTIIQYVFSIRERQPDIINVNLVDNFIQNGCQDIENILQLQ